MAIPYMFVKALSGEGDGFLDETREMSAEDSIDYLMQPGAMRGKILGSCLDSCRIGTMTTCYWPTDISGIMQLIEKWRNENGDDIRRYHEKDIDELWTRFELPWINHDKCPRDEGHLGEIIDASGNVRCSHKSIMEIKQGFFVQQGSSWDYFAQTKKLNFYEDTPVNPKFYRDEVYGDEISEETLEEAEKKWEMYESAGVEEIPDVCYSIIRESKDKPMPFETALRRLDILGGQNKTRWRGEPSLAVEFPFGGWTLAHYLQKWRMQGDDAPWRATRVEKWMPREHIRICSDD